MGMSVEPELSLPAERTDECYSTRGTDKHEHLPLRVGRLGSAPPADEVRDT